MGVWKIPLNDNETNKKKSSYDENKTKKKGLTLVHAVIVLEQKKTRRKNKHDCRLNMSVWIISKGASSGLALCAFNIKSLPSSNVTVND